MSLDVTILYTNVLVPEAIEVAVQKVYLHNEPPPLQKEVFKRLLQLAVSNVQFKCGAKWYVQTDGLAMGASLAVILSNLWMKKFEFILSSSCSDPSRLNDTEKCSECNHRVCNHDRGVQCGSCNRWYHIECQGINESRYNNFEDEEGLCRSCSTDRARLLQRYVDDILVTRHPPKELLSVVNRLHPNLKFTIETLDNSLGLAFLDMRISRSGNRLSFQWYQKPTDTGVTMNFRSFAPVEYKKNFVRGAVHRVFNATSSWESFHQGICQNQSIWKQNQFPEKWSSAIARRTLSTILAPDKLKDKPTPIQRDTHRKRISFFVQYRGTISDQLVQRLKKVAYIDIYFLQPES